MLCDSPNNELDEQEILRFVVPAAAAGERLDKWLASVVPGISRARLQAFINEGRVQINGGHCRPRDNLVAGSEVLLRPGPAATTSAEPDASVSVDVVYEDEHLLVVNKPPGLVVHPARGHATGTLVNGLLARGTFAEDPSDSDDEQEHVRPGIVHRIDKDTSGLLVVTKSDAAREGLKEQLAAHSVERTYLAITCGIPKLLEIRTLYGRHPSSRLRFSSKVKAGKSAATHVRVIEVLAAGHAAFVECRLETGRTHQIRVHLTEQAQSPLLADSLYKTALSNDVVLQTAVETMGRQALHAGVLGFVHPITGEHQRFEVAPPVDFSAALELLRAIRAS